MGYVSDKDQTHVASLPALTELTDETFAPYGKVIHHKGLGKRHYFETDFSEEVAGAHVKTWVSRIMAPLRRDETLTCMERHPHTDQMFAPLSGQRFLVMVCDDRDGQPSPDTLRAFCAPSGTGVLFHRNIWHAGMRTFDAPAEFIVTMKTGLPDDDVFATLETPIPLAPYVDDMTIEVL